MVAAMARIASLLLVLMLVPCANARADAWRPVQQSCVSPDTSAGRCSAAHSGLVLSQAVVGPGGTVAYVASFQLFGGSGNAILIFNRDPATGRLTQRPGKAGCISQDGTGNTCETGPSIGANGMVVSPDGKQLYVEFGFTVLIFDIQADGGLVQKPGGDGCLVNLATTGCTKVRGMQGPIGDIAISGDGKNVYVAGTQLTVFRRTATGTLQQPDGGAGCFSPFDSDGCTPEPRLSRGVQMSLSPDQRSVYVAGDNGVVEFDRLANGNLQRLDCITTDGSGRQCVTDARLVGPAGALTSPDGRQVYVSTRDGVITYSRAGDGRLSFQSCINDRGTAGCRAGVQMVNLSFMAISPDGQDLVAAADAGGDFNLGFTGGIVTVSRDPATGDLTQRAGPDVCVTNNGSGVDEGVNTPGRCLAVPLSTGPGRITFASDSQFYAGGSFSGVLFAYKRDFYPTCASSAAAVPHDGATSVALQCGDRNGDPLTLQISASTISGTLGGIDQAGRRVTYVPFPGYTGPDSFHFNAAASGLTSDDATVSLDVAAAQPGAGGGGSSIDADHDGFFSGQDCNDRDPAIHPGAREVRGNRVDENCDGLAEPFPTLSTGVSTKWRVSGKHLTLTQLRFSQPPRDAKLEIRCAGRRCPFKRHTLAGKLRGGFVNGLPSLGRKVRFLAGQTIEVRVSATGFNTKVAQLKLKAGQIPTTIPLCLAPGGTTPRRTCD